MTYSSKLKNPKWQRKRLEAFQRDDFKCCLCDDEKMELHVHHLKYTNEPWEALIEDLQTLCEVCHKVVEIIKIIREEGVVAVSSFKFETSVCVKASDSSVMFFAIDNDEISFLVSFAPKSKALAKLIELDNE
jgi:hypothetical protein